jgi:glucose-1-phosphate cytidylyltransferase
MKIYGLHGINEFIICCGYKGNIIKEYFKNYFSHSSDVTISINENDIEVHGSNLEHWKVTLVDTGENTMTGGRLKRVESYIKDDDFFCFTYGDGVGDINISEIIDFHKKNKKLATITATRPQARFGALKFGENNQVKHFEEKPDGDGNWINGGFFVLSPKVIDYIKDDQTKWENEPLTKLAREGQLYAFKHKGFWMPMDTLREKIMLNKLWNDRKAPWKTW